MKSQYIKETLQADFIDNHVHFILYAIYTCIVKQYHFT